MKKVMLSVATVFMLGMFMLPTKKADAQVGYTDVPPTSFGVKVGPNFSNITSKVDGKSENGDILVGFQGGVYANIGIAPQFYIQPSLMYEGKGAKHKDENGDMTTRLNYLTLPVDFLFKPEMPNGSGSWIVGVGPYFGYGISGKMEVEGLDANLDPFKESGLGDDAAFKRFDVGANVQLGYEMASGINIALNANLGLVDINNVEGSDNSVKNTSFGVTVGYTLR